MGGTHVHNLNSKQFDFYIYKYNSVEYFSSMVWLVGICRTMEMNIELTLAIYW